MPFLNNAKKVENRERSKSENQNQAGILHPHKYAGINKISRQSQTSHDIGQPSIWSPKFKRKKDASTQTPEIVVPNRARIGKPRTRIRTNPRIKELLIRVRVT